MKKGVKNFALVSASLLLSLLFLEAITRFFVAMPLPYNSDPGAVVRDARGFWTMQPGARFVFDNRVDFRDKPVHIDPDGGRRIPCAKGIPRDARRIILIGDSQTFGVGLADGETWANRVQCRLNSAGGGKKRVYNLGVPGTGVDEYFNRGVNQVVPAVRPGDIVVVSLTWNDLHTFYTGESWLRAVLERAGLQERGSDDPTTAEVRALARQDETPSPVNGTVPLASRPATPIRRLHRPTWRYRMYRDYGLFIPATESLWEFGQSMVYVSAAFRVAWSRARLLYYRFRPSDELFRKIPKRAFKANFLVLKALDTMLRRRGAEMVIQLLPNRLFFDDYYYRAYSQNGVVFPARDFVGYVSKPFCDSLKLKCLNRFPDLRTAERDAHTFAFDGHFNEAGAARIAAALATDLKTVLQD